MDENLKRKLQSLKGLAQGRGTTEAEAMAAAAKLAEIMREHGLADHDIEYEEADVPLKTKRHTTRSALLGLIATCTNCVATVRTEHQPCAIFLGKAPGPEIATYLFALCDRAIDRAVAAFQKTPEYLRRRTLSTRRAATADFTAGMVERLCARIYALFRDGIDEEAFKAACRVRDLRFPNTATAKIPTRKVRFTSSAAAGMTAGHKVQLAQGVNGGRSVQKIGGK